MSHLKQQLGTHNAGYRALRAISGAIIVATATLKTGLPGWDHAAEMWKPKGDLILDWLVFGLLLAGAVVTGLLTSEKPQA